MSPRARGAVLAAIALASLALAASSCARERTRRAVARDTATMAGDSSGGGDSAFARLQRRGERFMGVNQYTSAHRFESLPDGGRIELQRDTENAADTAGIRTIREHLRGIADAFARGDFTIPGAVHDTGEVPGTRVMAAKRAAISYAFRPLPRGGEVRITTTDPAAVAAVHEFLAFQRREHHAAAGR
jgi:hypothetical protein